METLARAANRGSISTGYDIDNSLKFEADNTEYLSWSGMTSYATDARKRTWSISFWCKRTEIGQQQLPWNSGGNGTLAFQAADHINFQQFFSDSATAAKYLNTNRLFRDPSAWYHIIIAIDTTQATEAHRMRLYVNGEEETSFSSTVYPPQNATATDIYGSYISLGRSLNWGAGFSGYIANYYLISEVQLVPTDVGEYDEDSGIWKPKAYAGAITAPSTFLEFKDSSNFKTATSGLDASVSSNLTAADQATDTPTNNFAVFNTLYDYDGVVINEGATKTTNENTANWRSLVSNIAVQNGKWYAEFTAGSNSGFVGVGLVEEMTGDLPKTQYLGQLGESIGYYGIGLLFYSGASQTGSFTGYGTGDVIGIALDKTNGFVYWHKNGTWQNSGDPTSGSSGTGGVALSSGYSGYAQSDYYIIGYAHSTASTAYANFGGYTADTPSSAASDANGYGTFEYAPPSGYYALCTKNLAEFG